MFHPNKTVFILGAGASWHFGYPTGEELVKKVIAKARLAANHFATVLNSPANRIPLRPQYITRNSPAPVPANGLTGIKAEWQTAIDECNDLVSRLTTVDPLVIGYFLGQNPHLGDIGKFCIAWILLECEAVFLKYGINNNRRELLLRTSDRADREKASSIQHLRYYNDNWYRFLIHKLVTGCPDADSLLDNKVTFVTFNYDVSLEFQLFQGLSAIAQFAEGNIIRQFFEGSWFIHIYGKMREDATAPPPSFDLDLLGGMTLGAPKAQPGPAQLWNAANALFDTVYEASKGIRTIAPLEKTVEPAVECARQAIADASCVYILGYGFDENNRSLLELPDSLSLTKSHKTVMFTNFGDHNLVNKKASRLFFKSPERLLSDKPAILGTPSGVDGFRCEKSTRNVYDALAVDFDSPEEHLLSTTPI
jgi:hypothetical protein